MSAPSRVPRPPRSLLFWAVPVVVAAGAIVILAARWAREQPAIQEFLVQYPGAYDLPDGAPVGFPAWLAWQHFFNAFLLVLIVRSGRLVRSERRPSAYWTRRNTGILRTASPPQRISIQLWFHLALDVLWLLNGFAYLVLLFATGQWVRIVPTTWEVLPNAVSAALQYASFAWPTEQGWVNYNSLQQLSYFVTVFVAAPLAAATGLRMSGAWPAQSRRLSRVFPIALARAVHFPVMIYFVAFVVVHVFLVLTTGAVRNLNHMFALRDDESWWGVAVFAVSLVVIVLSVVAVRPSVVRALAGLTGRVSR